MIEEEEDDNKLRTIDLRLVLPERIYHTSFAISVLLHYENYSDYVEDLIIHDIDVFRDRSSDEISDEELRQIGV